MGTGISQSYTEPFTWSGEEVFAKLEDNYFAKGTSKYVFRGRITPVNNREFNGGEQCVVKLYKEECFELEEDTLQADKRVSLKTKEMAERFNVKYNDKGIATIEVLTPIISKVKKIASHILPGYAIVTEGASVAIENFLQEGFVRFSNNLAYLNPDVDTLVPVAFSHFTYHESNGKILVTDLQGVFNKKSYIFTDPAIHSIKSPRDTFGYYGSNDLGVFGVMKFFQKHKCNRLCDELLKPDMSKISDDWKGDLDQVTDTVELRSVSSIDDSTYTYEFRNIRLPALRIQELQINVAKTHGSSGRHPEQLHPHRNKGAQSEAAPNVPTTMQQEAQISATSDPETTVSKTRPGRLNAQPSLPEYGMDRNPRGMCMIINNVIFEGLSEPRRGSEIDKGKLDNLFNKLHFQVEVRENLTAHDMLAWLKKVSLLDHKKYDCFACCIMTHGTLGEVCGTDNKSLEIQQILELFTGVSCESLIGKPKLFFIQACQGDIHQEGVEKIETDQPTGVGAGIPKTLPKEADFLLSYSTVPGYVSYRNETEGSWYVNALVDEISSYHNTTHMLDILTSVNNKLCDRNAPAKCGKKLKQVPAPTYTLTKAVYLRSLVK